MPFGEKEAKARYEQEVKDRQAAGLAGPVQLETTTRPEAQTLYFVESIPSKCVGEAGQAIMRIKNRIENYHKCKSSLSSPCRPITIMYSLKDSWLT